MLYTLKKGAQTAMVDSHGAELVSYVNGKEYLWQADPLYWAGCSPVLFPFPGALMDDRIKINGKSYIMPKHGIVRNDDFELVELTESSAMFCTYSNAETKKKYPFDYKLFVKHEIMDNGVKTSYKIRNTGNETMYFCLGAHPSFNCPLNEIEGFEDYEIIFEKEESPIAYYTEQGYYLDPEYKVNLINKDRIDLKYSDFDRDAYIIRDLNSTSLKLLGKKSKEGIKLNFKGFPAIVVWSPTKKNAPFVCIEPWLGLPAIKGETGNFEDKDYAVKLPAGQDFDIAYEVEIIK